MAVTDPCDPWGTYQPRHDVDPSIQDPQPSGSRPSHQLPYGRPISASPYPSAQPPSQIVVVSASGPPSSGLAVAALIFAILGLVGLCCTFGVFSLFAVIFGHAARADTKRGLKTGHSTATAALILGYIGVVPAVVASILTAAGVKP